MNESRREAIDEMASGIEVALAEVRRQRRQATERGDGPLAGIATTTETRLLEAQQGLCSLAVLLPEPTPAVVTITKPTHEWSDIVVELTWIGTDGDFRGEEERTPDDREDAERLMRLIEGQMPASYDINGGVATVELTEADQARLTELTAIF